MSLIASTRRFLETLGVVVIGNIHGAAELGRVFARTLAGVVRGGRPRGEVLHQVFLLGNKSLFFAAVTLGFLGMVMVYQICLQLNRITGDLSLVGAQFIKVLVQDLGPTLTAMMLATRVGAGIAAEIGSMQVTEQIDALRMSGVRPIDYLIVPRFLACVVATVALSIFGTLVAYAAGGLTAWSSFGVNPRTFFTLDAVNLVHVGLGLTKAMAYGMTIPVVAGFCGLQARGSAEGVGWATTAAVIGGSLGVLLWDFLLSGAALLLLGDRL